MRALRALFCAAALVACLAPGVRADEYTKQTFLTFSGPVQLPGITLPAGTYQFRLADPESGRQALQVWDKDGNKLFTTLLTIPDQRPKVSDEPVVMFGERAAGEAQPIRSWFYPNDTYGQEFVYPKDQAMKIAKDTHSSVLAFESDTKDSEFKSARISRMDENGQITGTHAGAADDNTAAQSSNAQSDASLNTPARSASAQSQSEPRTPMPSANRTDGSAPVGTSGSTTTAPAATSTTSEANRDNMPAAVGTTGATNNAASANHTAQAAAGANAAAPRATASQQPPPASPTGTAGSARALPKTASSMTLVQMLAALSLAGAFAVHMFRARSAR